MSLQDKHRVFVFPRGGQVPKMVNSIAFDPMSSFSFELMSSKKARIEKYGASEIETTPLYLLKYLKENHSGKIEFFCRLDDEAIIALSKRNPFAYICYSRDPKTPVSVALLNGEFVHEVNSLKDVSDLICQEDEMNKTLILGSERFRVMLESFKENSVAECDIDDFYIRNALKKEKEFYRDQVRKLRFNLKDIDQADLSLNDWCDLFKNEYCIDRLNGHIDAAFLFEKNIPLDLLYEYDDKGEVKIPTQQEVYEALESVNVDEMSEEELRNFIQPRARTPQIKAVVFQSVLNEILMKRQMAFSPVSIRPKCAI